MNHVFLRRRAPRVPHEGSAHHEIWDEQEGACCDVSHAGDDDNGEVGRTCMSIVTATDVRFLANCLLEDCLLATTRGVGADGAEIAKLLVRVEQKRSAIRRCDPVSRVDCVADCIFIAVPRKKVTATHRSLMPKG